MNPTESFLCKFTFTQAANNTNATLVNDFFWKVFHSVRLYIGTQEVEAVDYVSATSEMMKFTQYSFRDRMGKGAVKGFIPDMATGTNTDPGYSQRKGMYNDDTKAGKVLMWQFLFKVNLDFVIMIKFCMVLKLDFNCKGMIMKIDCFLVWLMLLLLRINF